VTTGKNGQNVLPSCNINIYTVFGKKTAKYNFCHLWCEIGTGCI